MAKFRVAMTNSRRDASFEYERPPLAAIDAELVAVQVDKQEDYAAAIADFDAVAPGLRVKLSGDVIRQLKKCKVIATNGIGVDSVDLDAATEMGIPVCNVPDIFTEEVADQAFMLLLTVNRKLLHCHEHATTNRWQQGFTGLGSMPKIQGKTLGLVAFGNIAKVMARRGIAFGLKVIAHDPFVSAEEMAKHHVESRSLDDLMRESDFLSSHAPLNKSTYHMLSDHHFGLMKRDAIFINTGRGPTVDEPALIRALQSGQIAGAGLDVLEQEPPDPNNPLLKMANVVVTPHMASYSNESNIARRIRQADEMAAVLTGRKPRNVVNKAVLAKLKLT